MTTLACYCRLEGLILFVLVVGWGFFLHLLSQQCLDCCPEKNKKTLLFTFHICVVENAKTFTDFANVYTDQVCTKKEFEM